MLYQFDNCSNQIQFIWFFSCVKCLKVYKCILNFIRMRIVFIVNVLWLSDFGVSSLYNLCHLAGQLDQCLLIYIFISSPALYPPISGVVYGIRKDSGSHSSLWNEFSVEWSFVTNKQGAGKQGDVCQRTQTELWVSSGDLPYREEAVDNTVLRTWNLLD